MNRPPQPLSLLLPLLLLAACADPAPRDPAAAAVRASERACRDEADRVLLFRDRGQTMRADETIGSPGITSHLDQRVPNDSLGQRFARDRMVADCLRSSAAQNQPGTAPGAATPPPTARPRGS